jgi:hypothetical protein
MLPESNWTVLAALPLESAYRGAMRAVNVVEINPMDLRDTIRWHTTRGVRQAWRELWAEVQIQHRHFVSLRKSKRLLPQPTDLRILRAFL